MRMIWDVNWFEMGMEDAMRNIIFCLKRIGYKKNIHMWNHFMAVEQTGVKFGSRE